MCLTVGMIGGPYVKGMVGKVKETPVRSVTFHANLERIAVINLDTGVEKKGEQIYYAAKLIEYPDESYQTSSDFCNYLVSIFKKEKRKNDRGEQL